MDDRIPEEYEYDSTPASTPEQSHRFARDHDRMSVGSTGTFIGHPETDFSGNDERGSSSTSERGDISGRPRRREDGGIPADMAGGEVDDRYARDTQTPEAWFA